VRPEIKPALCNKQYNQRQKGEQPPVTAFDSSYPTENEEKQKYNPGFEDHQAGKTKMGVNQVDKPLKEPSGIVPSLAVVSERKGITSDDGMMLKHPPATGQMPPDIETGDLFQPKVNIQTAHQQN